MYIIVALLSLAAASTVFFGRARPLASYALIVFYVGIDYSNYVFHLGGSLAGTLAKSFKEMLFFSLLLLVAYSVAKRRLVAKEVLVLLVASTLLLAYGAFSNGFFAAAVDWRDSVLPVVTAALLAACGLLTERRLSRLVTFFALVIAVNSIFAVFQYYTFNGDAESSWRYDFLLQESLRADSYFETRLIEYQITRGGDLRSSGLFASALQYSYSAALACFYFYCASCRKLSRGRVLAAMFPMALMLVCALGVYVSQVRASLVIVVVSIAVHAFAFSAKGGGQYSVGRAAVIGFGCVGAFVTSLILFYGSFDGSVQGRVPQYALVLEEFKLLGHGVGTFRGRFDSYYVYGLLTFGAVFILWMIWVFLLYRKAFGGLDREWEKGGDLVLRGFIFSSIVPALVIACFQHFSASLYYQLIWVMLFAALRSGRVSPSSAGGFAVQHPSRELQSNRPHGVTGRLTQ